MPLDVGHLLGLLQLNAFFQYGEICVGAALIFAGLVWHDSKIQKAKERARQEEEAQEDDEQRIYAEMQLQAALIVAQLDYESRQGGNDDEGRVPA